MKVDINLRQISSLEAQVMILDDTVDNLYFATEYMLPRRNIGGYQPRKVGLSEVFKYGSCINKFIIFRPKASPKNILNFGEEYLGHKWFIKELS